MILTMSIYSVSYSQNISINELNNEFEIDKEEKKDILNGIDFNTFKVKEGYFVFFLRYKYYLNSGGKSGRIPYFLLFDANKKFLKMGEIVSAEMEIKNNVQDIIKIKDKIYLLIKTEPDEGIKQLWIAELNTTNGSIAGKPIKLIEQKLNENFMGIGFITTQISKKPFVYSMNVSNNKIEITYNQINENFKLASPIKFYYTPTGDLPEIKVNAFEIDELGNAHLIFQEGTGENKNNKYINTVYSYYIVNRLDSKKTITNKIGGTSSIRNMPAAIGFDKLNNTYICVSSQQVNESEADPENYFIYKYGKDSKLIKQNNVVLNEAERKELYGNYSASYYKISKSSLITRNTLELDFTSPVFNISLDGNVGSFLIDSYSYGSGAYQTHKSFLWLVFNTSTLDCARIPFGRKFTSFDSDLEKVTVLSENTDISLVYYNTERNYTEDLKPVPYKKMVYDFGLNAKAHIYKCTVNSLLAVTYNDLYKLTGAEYVKLFPLKFEESNYYFLNTIKKSEGTFNLLQLKLK